MQNRSFSRVLLALTLLGVAAAAAAAERTLAVDRAQSQIEIVVKATVDSFTAHLDAFEPTVTLDEHGQITGARVAFHFRDVHTGKSKRDQAMHEWQHTDEFPDGVFVLDSFVRENGSQARATGRLTLHGATHGLSFPVSIVGDSHLLAIDGDAPVDVRAFGLPVIRLLGLLKVDPVVHVRFHLQGRVSS